MPLKKKILIAGFNTRPLVYSLYKAGYEVYAVDFFGDLDLYPYVADCLVLTKKINATYDVVKNNYSQYLPDLILELLEKHPSINYLVIGSGLDDAIKERERVLKEIQREKYKILSLNNSLDVIQKSRNVGYIFNFMQELGYIIPSTTSFNDMSLKVDELNYPFVFKKKSGSGGVNVFKITDRDRFPFILNLIKSKEFNPKEWVIQEFIEGNPVSCTIISNGKAGLIVSINQQIIGETYLNAPQEFMYCGNIVPAKITEEEKNSIIEISLKLTSILGLKGINGFDFVLKNHYPYLMEINPRIPGSIRASEEALNLNLLDLHIKSFFEAEWEFIKKTLKDIKQECYTTKLIFFAPREIQKSLLSKINDLEHVHDKSEPNKNIRKNEPVCTTLFSAKTISDSFLGSLRIVDKIKKIIG
jgi:predicted ATP-grasp superfamily ATP-dependent carboligase